MIYTEAVRDRIEEAIPELAGRIQFATEWAKVVESNQLPQSDFAGFVLPGGLRGGIARAITGIFIQDLEQSVSVVLCKRVPGDPLGGRAIDIIRPFVETAIEAIAGWEPPAPEGKPEPIGVFQFQQGELVGAMKSSLVFQLDFLLNDQLRITST